MRDLDPIIDAALQAGALKERKFYIISAPLFSTGEMGTAYFWNDLGPITAEVVNGLSAIPVNYTFQGSGTLINSGSIPLSSDLAPRNVVVTLNQVDDRVDSLVRGYNLKNAYCELYSGLFDPIQHFLLSPAPCDFSGFVDGCTIKSPPAGSSGQVELRLVSHTREFTRAGYQTRSDLDQKKRSGTDDLFKYGALMGTRVIYWNQQRVVLANAPNATSSAQAGVVSGSGGNRLTGGLR